MARTLDVGATLRFHVDVPASPAERDARALANDWRNVGADLQRAIASVRADVESARRIGRDAT